MLGRDFSETGCCAAVLRVPNAATEPAMNSRRVTLVMNYFETLEKSISRIRDVPTCNLSIFPEGSRVNHMARSTIFSTNSSAIVSITTARDVAVHRWPVEPNAP